MNEYINKLLTLTKLKIYDLQMISDSSFKICLTTNIYSPLIVNCAHTYSVLYFLFLDNLTVPRAFHMPCVFLTSNVCVLWWFKVNCNPTKKLKNKIELNKQSYILTLWQCYHYLCIWSLSLAFLISRKSKCRI